MLTLSIQRKSGDEIISNFKNYERQDDYIDYDLYYKQLEPFIPLHTLIGDNPNPDFDPLRDNKIFNRIDVCSISDIDGVWNYLTLAVTKMGWFGIYCRIAMSIECGRTFVLTYDEFMHIVGFLKKVEIGQWNIINGTIGKPSIYENFGTCIQETCPGKLHIIIDMIHHLVFIRSKEEHFECDETQKRRVYDAVRKLVVRYNGDLDFISNQYSDAPRRYGLGYVESWNNNCNNFKKSGATWASTQKRRVIYTTKKAVNAPSNEKWQVTNGVKNAVSAWRRKYFTKQDKMAESISKNDWKTDYKLVQDYWKLAGLNRVSFLEKGIVILKDIEELKKEKVWYILFENDERLQKKNELLVSKFSHLTQPRWKNGMTPIEHAIYLRHSHDWKSFNQLSSFQYREAEHSNPLGLTRYVESSTSKYMGPNNSKVYTLRICSGDKTACFVIGELESIWDLLSQALGMPIEEMGPISVVSRLNLDNKQYLHSTDEPRTNQILPSSKVAKLPNNITAYIVDHLSTPLPNSSLNEFFPPDVLFEFCFLFHSIINTEKTDYSKLIKLIKSKAPRQRSPDNEPLKEPLYLSTPQSPLPGITTQRIAYLTGTARVAIFEMLELVQYIKKQPWMNLSSEELEEHTRLHRWSKAVMDIQAGWNWCRERQPINNELLENLRKWDSVKIDPSVDLLKLVEKIWEYK
ncbi:hypothetical protein DAMA08_011150 [Martiniozyma asiatica (nom. inval.)]|nr:hypothetical protein DAMA08_011150 [Martiniozyma asiatica]